MTKLFTWLTHLFSTVSVNILARQIKAGIDKKSKFIDGNHSRYVECMRVFSTVHAARCVHVNFPAFPRACFEL